MLLGRMEQQLKRTINVSSLFYLAGRDRTPIIPPMLEEEFEWEIGLYFEKVHSNPGFGT